MKKYYYHNGLEEQGPFDIDELKTKNLTKDSQIWHEGLSVWTSAGSIDELKDLINKTTPPPFSKNKKQIPHPIIMKLKEC